MAMESEITLDGTTRASEFEFRAVAMNKAGEGEGTGEDSVWCKTRKALSCVPFGILPPRNPFIEAYPPGG